jgi:hypothetical protein
VFALQQVEGVTLSATDRSPANCRVETAKDGAQVLTELPRGGAILEAGLAAKVSISRFGSVGVSIGTLSPKTPTALVVPPDELGSPWEVTVAAPSIRVCPLPAAAS